MSTPTVRRAPGALFRRLPNEVLVTAPGAEIHRISGSGVAVWELLETPVSMGHLVSALAQAHGSAPESIGSDVRQVVDYLVGVGLIEEVPAS